MPTYEYACTSCGQHLEVVQSFKDEPLTTCETCGGELRKVFSPIGVVFKGSGFYKTDNRSGRSGGAGASSSQASTTSGDGTGSSSGSGSSSSASSDSSSGSSGSSASGGGKSAASGPGSSGSVAAAS